MNVKLLKSRMVMYGDEDFVKSIATILDVSRQTASAKLNGYSKFTQPEISIIATHYRLTDDEIRKIFVEGESSDGEGSGEASR